jgi:hypothetical protein
MAKTDPEDDDDAPPIYKHATSKKLKAKEKGRQEAKKGDRATIDGEEMESLGTANEVGGVDEESRDKPRKPPDPRPALRWQRNPHKPLDSDKEFWAKPEEKPMS